jgi:hypothetical protein
LEAIIKLLQQMGYTHLNSGTPGRVPNQHTVTAIWKRPNQARSPAKAYAVGADDEEIEYANNASLAVVDDATLAQVDQIDDRKPAAKLSLPTDEEVSGDSSATNKIENLQITCIASSLGSNVDDSASSFDTSSLVDFPPLGSKKLPVAPPPILNTPAQSPRAEENLRNTNPNK